MAKASEPTKELDGLANRVIGAAMAVHRILGPGFGESMYEEALAIELDALRIPFSRQTSVAVHYGIHVIGHQRLDLLIDGVLIVELKAIDQILDVHRSQVLSYLKASRLHLGLLINFNVPLLKSGIRRIINSQPLGELGSLGALAVT